MTRKIFSENEQQNIINKYITEHLSMEKIGGMYGVSRRVISRILKNNNIPENG